MTDRNPISYARDLRDRAEAEGKTLGSVDCDLDGVRMTVQTPANEEQAEFLWWCGLMLMSVPANKLPDMRRMYRRREAADD